MTNSRAKSGWTKLEHFSSGSALATKTFTFPAIDWTQISHLVLVIKGEATAVFNLSVRLNSVAAATHNFESIIAGGGSLTGGAGSEGRVATSAKTIAQDKSFHVIIEIFVNPIGTKHATYTSQSMGDTITECHGGSNQTDSSTFVSIIVETSTSTWKTGTLMDLYSVP